MERDEDALRGGYSSYSYIEALQKVSCLLTGSLTYLCRITLVYTPLELLGIS